MTFASPKWVPRLVDAAEVMDASERRGGTEYAVLTPYKRGFDAALAASADEIALLVSGSGVFSQKNIIYTVAESLDRFAPIVHRAWFIYLARV